MALRDFYAVSDGLAPPPAEPISIASGLAVEPPPARPHPVRQKSAGAGQSQDMAVKLEQARLRLQQALCSHPAASRLLLAELDKSGSEAEDARDSACLSIVQGVAADKVDSGQMSRSAAEIEAERLRLAETRLFASCLLKVADQALKAKIGDAAFTSEVNGLRRELSHWRQQMIECNTGLVTFVACKQKSVHLSFEDLTQEGIIGLIKAVDRFDASRGICFSTYAVFWIKQAISRLILKQEKVVRLPVALAEKASVVFEAMRNFFLECNRWPSLEELRASCDLSMEDIKTISNYYQDTHSLDAAISEDADDLSLLDKLRQTQFPSPLSDLIEHNLSDYVERLILGLPEKEAAIITMRFGLRNHSEMTLQAIADQLQLTRERVRQIQNQALQKLKQQFGFDLLPFLEPNDILNDI